jgi:hypothetical protein
MSRCWSWLAYTALIVFQVALFLAAVERPAYGYVDPGSGMLVVQFVGSILSGGVFFLRKRLKQFFFPVKSAQVSQQAGEIKS